MTLQPDPLKMYSSIGALFHNRYWLQAQLGMGGTAGVYHALDTRLDRPVAIKILATDQGDTQRLERVRREATSIAKLAHPGIVRIYDFDQSDGLFYLSLELIAGCDLWTLLAECDDILPLPSSVNICLSILDALDYAHRQGVIHRDLKPENVIVNQQFQVSLVDFGLASIRGVSRIMCDGIVYGSVYYLAPEVIQGQLADERSDLYAFGVMLYELTTGRLPFYDASPAKVISYHENNLPPRPTSLNAEIPSALEAIILKLLAKHPDERFQSAAEARAALDQVTFAQSVPSKQKKRIFGWGGRSS